MDAELPSDFKSVRERFQSAGRSSTLPAYTTKREVKPVLPPKISNVRCNPALQGIINSLENKAPEAAPPTPSKPELLPKPNCLPGTHDMRVNRGFRQTLHITDLPRTEGDGMCAKTPQVYRHSLPTLQDLPPNIYQPQPQEDYEEIDSAWRPPITPSPINKPKIAGSKPPPAPIGPKPVQKTISSSPQMTSSPVPDAAKDKNTTQVPKNPSLKTLPPLASLGSPPSKPPRPMTVDLSAFFKEVLQRNGMSKKPEETSEVEYEEPETSPISDAGAVYDEAISVKNSASDSNVYEVDNMDFDPSDVFSAPDPSSLDESDEMVCYEDVLKIRESRYNSSFYEVEETNPVNSPETSECTYEVSAVNNNDFSHSNAMSQYASTASSVSEGYCSVDMNTTNELLQSKSKEVKMDKNEQMFRKKFKISGQEAMLYTSTITDDFKPEKFSLPVKKGATVEVIRITDCPPGKWLTRDALGNYGFVPVASLQVIDDIKAFSNQQLVINPDHQVLYADIEIRPKDSGGNADTLMSPNRNSIALDDMYDDISNTSQTSNSSGGKGKGFGHLFKKDKSVQEDGRHAPVIPNMNRTSSQENEYDNDIHEPEREKEEKSPVWKGIFNRNKDLKGKPSSSTPGVKKFVKEEKIFCDKFKYTGDINVVNIATVNDLAPLSTKDKLELAVKPGETVEIIDVVSDESDEKIICRNFAGKYGYVRIECLNFNIQHCN